MFSLEDENTILNFYIAQLSQICQQFPLKVEVLLLKFYL
jgi:hypothetical protein